MPLPGIDSNMIKKYGLPTAFAAAAFAGMVWMTWIYVSDARKDKAEIGAKVDALDGKIEKLRNDVDFANRNIDLTCGKK